MIEVPDAQYARLTTGQNLKGSFFTKTNRFSFDDAYVQSSGGAFSPSRVTHRNKINLFSFEQNKPRKNSLRYFRTLIPITTNFSLDNILEQESYTIVDHSRTRGLTRLIVDKKEFHIFIAEVHKKKYFGIDCMEKITSREYAELSWCIVVATGFISGHLLQDEEYVFSYSTKVMKKCSSFSYSKSRDTIKSFYTPINANPYAWVKKNRKVADGLYGKMTEITSFQFSQLAQLIQDEQEIRGVILLMIESLSRSLLLMPAGLSVALEGLSEYFAVKNEEKLKPVKDRNEAKNLRIDLLKVLSEYKEHELFTRYKIMFKKIENLNAPTNRDRLRAPFTIMDIRLSETDEEILEYRNDFLHGNISLEPRKNGRSYSMDEFEIALRLLTLLNMVILKMIAYEGQVINHVKMQEPGLRKKIKEDYYRII